MDERRMDVEEFEQVADELAVRRLYANYADRITRRAWDELDELFLPDCEVVIDTRRPEPVRATGGAGLADFVSAAVDRFDFFELAVLNVWVELCARDEARGRLYTCEIRHHRDDGRRSDAFGIYHDDLRRVDDRWQFARRRYHSLARTAEEGDRDMEVFPFPHAAFDA